MSKRGEKKPYKVDYEWSPSGIKGRVSYSSYDGADLKAAEIRRAGDRRAEEGITVRVEIKHCP